MSETGLVANRELFKGNQVAFHVGDPVPYDAYPPHQMSALIANGGVRRGLVNAVPPKAEAPKEVPAAVAGMYESPHDAPAADAPTKAPAKSKARKAKAV